MPPCPTCPSAPKTPSEWFFGLGFATQFILVLVLVSSTIFGFLPQQGMAAAASSSPFSLLLALPLYPLRSLLDYSPVLSIWFLFKMLLLAGLLDRVEKQVCGEHLPSLMAFPGNELFTPSELTDSTHEPNRRLLVRSLRFLWTYIRLGGLLSATACVSGLFKGVFVSFLWGSSTASLVDCVRSSTFLASSVMPVALMFLLGTALPNDRMALPAFLSGTVFKARTQPHQRGFAAGQSINTYDRYMQGEQRKKGYPTIKVSLVYLIAEMLLSQTMVGPLCALVVGGGVGTSISKRFFQLSEQGHDPSLLSLSPWSASTSEYVRVGVDLLVSRVFGQAILGLAQMSLMRCTTIIRKTKAAPGGLIAMLENGSRHLSALSDFYSHQWVFRPRETAEVPLSVYKAIRGRNIRKYEDQKSRLQAASSMSKPAGPAKH